MARLVLFLFTTLPAIFTAFLSYYGRKYTTAIAGLLAFASMLVIFVSCINLILQSILTLVVVPAWLTVSVGMFMPSNFALVLSAMVSGRICRAAWDYGQKKTDIVVKAN